MSNEETKAATAVSLANDGVAGGAPRREEWRIAIDGDSFYFARFINGQPDECYRSVGQSEASVWAAAIIQGFQPPRRLCRSDRSAD